MVKHTCESLSDTRVTRKARRVKFRICPSCIYETGLGSIFTKRNQVFQKERKKYYLLSSVISAMQAFSTSPDNSLAEADDLQLKYLYFASSRYFQVDSLKYSIRCTDLCRKSFSLETSFLIPLEIMDKSPDPTIIPVVVFSGVQLCFQPPILGSCQQHNYQTCCNSLVTFSQNGTGLHREKRGQGDEPQTFACLEDLL